MNTKQLETHVQLLTAMVVAMAKASSPEVRAAAAIVLRNAASAQGFGEALRMLDALQKSEPDGH